MQSVNSPKPRIFGKGYGTHLTYNLKLANQFIKLFLQITINALIPGAFYEKAHWQIIELYHRMRGFRHGTESDHRCKECGTDMLSNDEVNQQRDDAKELPILRRRVEDLERLHLANEDSPAE